MTLFPRISRGKFLKNLWCCVFQIDTHNPRCIDERFSFNWMKTLFQLYSILFLLSRHDVLQLETSAFELFTMAN